MKRQREVRAGGQKSGVLDAAPPFRRLLVAVDGSEAAHAAVELARGWVGEHGSAVWFVQLTEEHRQRRSQFDTDTGRSVAEPADHVVVSGPTLGARNRQLVHGIAGAASKFGADVIVLGFERSRLTGHRLAPSLREQIMRASDLPVLVAPTRQPEATAHPDRRPGYDHSGEPTARRYAHV